MMAPDIARETKTVLITGCSSGFGRATARHFSEAGWNVIATMRNPDTQLQAHNIKVLKMDVTDSDSIDQVSREVGRIDVLVNNAGIGLINVFEATPIDHIRGLFETNTIGIMAVTQAFLPTFRAHKAGVVVNVTSSVTHIPMPMFAAYRASKAAVVAFSEVLAQELAAFNVNVKLVDPGWAPTTKFDEALSAKVGGAVPHDYSGLVENMTSMRDNYPGPFTTEQDVADAVFKAATDNSGLFRIPAGADAVALAEAASS